VTLDRNQAIRLARRLRELRESAVADLTQAQLAEALSVEGRVAAATLSSWESTSNPKTPSASRLSAYARFFCTPRSLEGNPHLIPEAELTQEEIKAFDEIDAELRTLSASGGSLQPHSFRFEAGPVVVVCPRIPGEVQGLLAEEDDPNFTHLRQYGDLDALVEVYGHLRAENPSLDVFHRHAEEVASDDLSSHLVLIGGIGWNRVTRRIQGAISRIPITQIEVPDLQTGEIFRIEKPGGDEVLLKPEYQTWGDEKELIADVGYIVRRRSPYQFDRTLTIFNGIHSRGVYGAVRCLTDKRVRDENERYLAERFPGGEFAILVRVPVITNETLSPDLRNPDSRLFEWDPNEEGQQ
jgi:transcriptional regulator with XRE-family HTH domain